jgi:hypothetical protein
VKTLATPEEAWALVRDVTKWKTWLLGVQQVQLRGPLASGAQGILFLGDGNVHEMLVHKYTQGHLEVFVKLKLGVRLLLIIDVSTVAQLTQIKMAGQLFGVMSFMHVGGWGKNLRTGLAPCTRMLGMLSQEIRY